MNEPFDWRRSDRRLFAIVAALFPLIILIGFARTYYLKFAFGDPPLPSLVVHLHGLIMTAWVLYFICQVALIRTKNARVHMRFGMLGIALAVMIIVIGFFTAAGGAKNPPAAAPPEISPLSFMAVPIFDLIMFAGLFAAAFYYRKRPASHKRLMLLTVLNFLPPAIARFPLTSLQTLGPPFFFGVPAVLTIVLLVYDTWRNKKLNMPFLVGSLALIASYPVRLMVSGTDPWMKFAAWVTTWAA